MKAYSLILLIIFSFSTLAEVFYLEPEKLHKKTFVKHKNIRLHCPKKVCLAAETIKNKKLSTYRERWGEGENPTSRLCEHVSVKWRVGYLGDGSEFSLCEFSDGSYAQGWDLLRYQREKKASTP